MPTNQDHKENEKANAREDANSNNRLDQPSSVQFGADPAEVWTESQNPINVGQNSYNDYLGDENRDTSQDSTLGLQNESPYRDDLAKETADKEPAIELGLINPHDDQDGFKPDTKTGA